MISVIIPTPDDNPVLIETLAALVAGVAEGVLRDAIIVGPSSVRIDDMAEAAGAVRVIKSGTQMQMITEAAQSARAELCFVIRAGLVPIGFWPNALAEGALRLRHGGEAGLLPLMASAGFAEHLKTGMINWLALVSGRAHESHALLAAKAPLSQGIEKFRFIQLSALVSDRKIHKSSH